MAFTLVVASALGALLGGATGALLSGLAWSIAGVFMGSNILAVAAGAMLHVRRRSELVPLLGEPLWARRDADAGLN